MACVKQSFLFFSAQWSFPLALENRGFLLVSVKRGFLMALVKQGFVLVSETKLQVGSCKTRLPHVSHFRSICFFVLHVIRITAARCCVGWRRPCIKLLFFISLQGACKWKHDCRAAALDVTGGSPNLFWLALLYASSGYISHAGNYAFWLEMRKFEMCESPLWGQGAGMNEKARVSPESARLSGVLLVCCFILMPY